MERSPTFLRERVEPSPPMRDCVSASPDAGPNSQCVQKITAHGGLMLHKEHTIDCRHIYDKVPILNHIRISKAPKCPVAGMLGLLPCAIAFSIHKVLASVYLFNQVAQMSYMQRGLSMIPASLWKSKSYVHRAVVLKCCRHRGYLGSGGGHNGWR
jgi:hypothetical protein